MNYPTMNLPLSYPEAIEMLNYLSISSLQYLKSEAIIKLNGLTSNVSALKNSITSKIDVKKKKLEQTLKYLEYTGVTPEDLNQLSVIHIAGTKGKGSTSAMCDSILREHGFKTGLYTSPHLVSVVERIKIDGRPISQAYFADVFTEVYEDLKNNKSPDEEMPAYFGFLTVMALKVFLMEEVDVAIVEVGIGGKYDMTNIVSNVPVAGITSLGLDHTSVLGHTIGEIAEQKAGIFKPGCKAYTVPQEQSAMNVLFDVARRSQCSLSVVPAYEAYNWIDVGAEKYYQPSNPTKYKNASLAIQLTHSWMNQRSLNSSKNMEKVCDENLNIKETNKFDDIIVNIPKTTFDAIQSNVWPGRCQILGNQFADIYIDGAHTIESVDLCSKWFKSHCRESSYKVLMFHVTKERNPQPLMEFLLDLKFNMALFVPNNAFSENDPRNTIDQLDLYMTIQEKMNICVHHSQLWSNMITEKNTARPNDVVQIFSSVAEALNFIYSYCNYNECGRPQILITGSLLLVGAALTVLDPFLIQSQSLQ